MSRRAAWTSVRKRKSIDLLAEMAQAGMAILMISSELEELVGLCDASS